MAKSRRQQTPQRGWDALAQYRQDAAVATGLILAVAIAIRIVLLVIASSQLDLEFWLTTMLFLVSAILPWLFYVDTGQEMAQLRVLAGAYIAVDPKKVVRGVYASVLAFALLIIASAWPPAFGLTLLTVKLVELWGSRAAKAQIRNGVAKLLGDRTVPQANKDAAAVQRTYYFSRPWDRLWLAEASIVLIGILAALASLLNGNASSSRLELAAAAVAFIGAVVMNEIVAGLWRAGRDNDLPAGFV